MLEQIKTQVVTGIIAAAVIAVAVFVGQKMTDGALISILGGATKAELAYLDSKKVEQCRVCFKETTGNKQCHGNRNTCSSWSKPNETGTYTEVFRDDTDDRGGWCAYQWKVECRNQQSP